MRLLVLGATGGIGNYLLEYATARGHEVTAFARSPQKIALKSEKLRPRNRELLGKAIDPRLQIGNVQIDLRAFAFCRPQLRF